jgi:hypothetical protein
MVNVPKVSILSNARIISQMPLKLNAVLLPDRLAAHTARARPAGNTRESSGRAWDLRIPCGTGRIERRTSELFQMTPTGLSAALKCTIMMEGWARDSDCHVAQRTDCGAASDFVGWRWEGLASSGDKGESIARDRKNGNEDDPLH